MPNLILQTDSYKLGHWRQYPRGTQRVYSYLESRGGQFPETVFFGLQYYLESYLAGKVVSTEDVEEAYHFCHKHFGSRDIFNLPGWAHIVEEHGGALPVQIKAVPEGAVVPTHNVLMTIENTCPQCFWVTNFLETLLLKVWYPITVATASRAIKQIILKFLQETGDPNLIDFKLHDFGYRGVSSEESAAIGAAAHLLNFKGTDTLAGIELLDQFYGAEMAGFSIPASEHSTITSWGREHEVDAFRNMLTQYPVGLVACVSDSYDIFKACGQLWGEELKQQILERDGTLVVRPDSGDPCTVVNQCLEILGAKFGYTTNSKGFKVLCPKVRLIQGDGVNIWSIQDILSSMKKRGWSADNIAFGMGGALLQGWTRDTQKFAFKCSAIQIDGKWHDVYKDPVTDIGKCSKKGRLELTWMPEGGYRTLPQDIVYPGMGVLTTMFLDGVVTSNYTLDEIRERCALEVEALAA